MQISKLDSNKHKSCHKSTINLKRKKSDASHEINAKKLLPDEIIVLIASFVPIHVRISTFSLLSNNIYNLIRSHPLCSVDILEWDSFFSNTFPTYNAILLRKEFSTRAKIHTKLISQFRIKRINLLSSDKKNDFFRPFSDKLKNEVESLGITWEPFDVFRDYTPSHVELDWFCNIRKIELLLPNSFMINKSEIFWKKVLSLKYLEELHINFCSEDNTLSCFVNETPIDVLQKVTHLKFYPSKNNLPFLNRFTSLRSIRIPSCNRKRPLPYDFKIETNKNLEIIIDVVHPWIYRFYELGEYLYLFPNVDRDKIHLNFEKAFREVKTYNTTFSKLHKEIQEYVLCEKTKRELLLQLYIIKGIFFENNIKRIDLSENEIQNQSLNSFSREIFLDDSEKSFQLLVSFIRQYNHLESVYPSVLEYFSKSFSLEGDSLNNRKKICSIM